MTTDKPEVVAHMRPAFGEVVSQQEYAGWEHDALRNPDTKYGDRAKSMTLEYSEPLIRLSDYEALQAECEKLRKDAERLDFIAQHPGWLRSHKGRWGCVSPFTNYSYPVFKTPRDAIDAAMQGTKP